MTETQWNKAVERLHKGFTVRLADGCFIIPFVSENGAAYSLRSETNCIIYTPDLDRIKAILFFKPKKRAEATP